MTDEFQAALGVALRRLKTSDRFESEVRRALADFSPETTDKVVQHLREKRVLNDQRLAGALVERNVGRSAIGANKLRAKLETRGAPDSEVEAALASAAEKEPELATNLLVAKFPGRIEGDRARAGRFLFSRGFDEDVVESALAAHFPHI